MRASVTLFALAGAFLLACGDDTGSGGTGAAGGGSTGGSTLGGNTMGGSAMGGSAMGGSAMGGSAMGGSAMGGNAMGGSAMGGSAMGGSAMGGSAMGGSAMGGSAMGGSAMGGGGSTANCTEITGLQPFFFAHVAEPVPNIDGPDQDDAYVFVKDAQMAGTENLALPMNANECGKTATCAAIYADQSNQGSGKTYFAKSGAIEFETFNGPFFGKGALHDITLVEVNVAASGAVTETGTGCVHIAHFPFDIQPPATGWHCDPVAYQDLACDCECGAADPDCMPTDMNVFGCQTGQTCDANGKCAGVPIGWTCAETLFNGGAGNGCDCECGAWDPDCDLAGEQVKGCSGGDVCHTSGTGTNLLGACAPAGWTCDPLYYDTGMTSDCDCGCGAVDKDCADALVASCNFCDNNGSCNNATCPGTINPTNNATCN